MSLSIKGRMDNRDAKLNLSNQVGMLNPNAAEFIPSALRATAGNTSSVDTSKLGTPMASGKAVLDRSESNVSSNSDDELHQYWRRQLPDDITPDFKSMAEDALKGSGHLPLANLSIHDGVETARYSMSSLGQTLGAQQEISPLRSNTTTSEKFSYTGSAYVNNHSSTAFMTRSASLWDKHYINEDHYFSNGKEGRHYNGDSAVGFLDDLFRDHADSEDIAINPVDILVSQFPGFSATSLAEVYYANGCDLNLTIELLTQLEIYFDCDKGSAASTAIQESFMPTTCLPVPPNTYNAHGDSRLRLTVHTNRLLNIGQQTSVREYRYMS